MSKKIFASNDKTKYTLVDDDVFEIIQDMNLKFCISKRGYFISTKWIQLPGMEKKKVLLLHQFVWILKTGEEPSSEVDHIDRNSSNNQFENLRLATRQVQAVNVKLKHFLSHLKAKLQQHVGMIRKLLNTMEIFMANLISKTK